MMTPRLFRIAALILLLNSNALTSAAFDWPMWRCDYHRSASTPEQLAGRLFLQWQADYSARTPVWDDPLNRDLMKFDRIFEPVVAGNRLFIGFNDQDKVLALDLETGKELWHFYADGPVRLPLAAHRDKLYFTGDDGWCYCLDQQTGSLVWKKLLAPSGKKLLGNNRLISMWPARGGIVIKDDILYTAASIFPMMGTFLYALHTSDGEVVWKNEGTGSNYILQPHNSPAFADVAPQGPFTISGDKLLVAGGRSVPAAFSLKSGEEVYYKLAANGKTGGAFTCANDRFYFNHFRKRMTNVYDTDSGLKLNLKTGEYPVIEGDTVYFSGKEIWAARLSAGGKLDTLWHSAIPASNDLIRAGDCLYAADSSGIRAIRLLPGGKTEVTWSYSTKSNVERLLAANGKLVAVTLDGTVMVFGDAPVADRIKRPATPAPLKYNAVKTGKLLTAAGTTEGVCLVLGGGDMEQLNGLLAETSLQLVVLEKNPDRVKKLREFFDKAGKPATRIAFLPAGEGISALPDYFSSLTVINDASFFGTTDNDLLTRLYETTRPYEGKILVNPADEKMSLLTSRMKEMNLFGAIFAETEGFSVITRHGPLKGASPWTHNYGNISNTVKSDDKLVKAPLGILWFGGNSNMDVLPRHGHGPGEQVMDGRLIIQGINTISARDVYTGRVLWKREFEKLVDDSWMVYYDETYDEENPLDTKYNQVHLPGSNARGTNFIVTKEYVYLLEGNHCNQIDIKTGKIAGVIRTGDENTSKLGYIGVHGDLLILGNNFAEFEGLENDSIRKKNPKYTDYNLTASKEILVMDRFSGKKIWGMKARHGFIHNSIIAGGDKIFCLDKLPQYLETKLKRRGQPQPEGSRLLCLEAATGKVAREVTSDIFGTWLGYSSEHNLLLQATRPSRDMLNGEEGNRMIAYDVPTGEKRWDKPLKYANPPILHNDKIYTNGEGFSLLTGDPLTEKDPVTGEELKWNFKREYGCGIVAASEYLLTFRSASAGFINLEAYEGTGNLGGWKAGCSTNLIAADGVLNSPDYTRTCQCPYQNQTSLALVHMPWMAYWTNSNYKWNGQPIQQLGLNFGAPGDRSSDDNVLWFEFPFIAGAAPEIPVRIDTSGYYRIRKEPFGIVSEKTPWVSASAIGGVRSLEITLTGDTLATAVPYTVKLYFSELEDKKPGERIFDVAIQGARMVTGLDIVKEAGKPDKEVVRSFSGIKAGKSIKIDLVPQKGNTIISGLELVRETSAIGWNPPAGK